MQDLANMLPSSPLIGNSSMAASNTISDQTGSLTAPGSESEQSAGTRVGTPVAGHGTGPEQPVGSPKDRSGSGSSYTPGTVAWALLPANGYSSKEM